MDVNIEDRTGSLVSIDDIDAAIRAAAGAITKIQLLMQTPELAVNLPNILRCLRELQAIRKHLEADKP